MAKPVRCLEDLDLWQVSIDFAVLIHDLTARRPADERFGLVSQMRKASVAIASSIAEGFGRRTTGEYLNCLSVASGENREVFTQLVIVQRKKYIAADDAMMVLAMEMTNRIGRMLTVLIRRLRA